MAVITLGFLQLILSVLTMERAEMEGEKGVSRDSGEFIDKDVSLFLLNLLLGDNKYSNDTTLNTTTPLSITTLKTVNCKLPRTVAHTNIFAASVTAHVEYWMLKPKVIVNYVIFQKYWIIYCKIIYCNNTV